MSLLNYVPSVLAYRKFLVYYVLSCLTGPILYVPSCLRRLVPDVFSCLTCLAYLSALMPDVPHALCAVVPHVPRALRTLVPYVPCALGALVVHLSCSPGAAVPFAPLLLQVSHVQHTLIHVMSPSSCVFCILTT